MNVKTTALAKKVQVGFT